MYVLLIDRPTHNSSNAIKSFIREVLRGTATAYVTVKHEDDKSVPVMSPALLPFENGTK